MTKINNFITILTPTYNRKETLGRLYKSIKNQTCKDFVWMIVDDGSSDNTKEYIEDIIKNNHDITIEYYYKKNGGKHTALNYGIERIQTELVFIVDSDDYLVDGAIEIVKREWSAHEKSDDICGICFLKGYDKEHCVGQQFDDLTDQSYITMRIKKGIQGDKSEIFKTSLLKEKKFPEIAGEKFIGEDYVWCDLGKKYNMIWRNDIIYICEYLSDGLSKAGRAMRIKCPCGGMLNSAMMLTREFPMKFRIKKGILYNCYYFFADKQSRKQYGSKGSTGIRILTFVPGFLLYKYWNRKYMEEK